MSRLIVKSLPAHCTEASLRDFFKSYGKLNDCTLKYTKEGKFRKFAFVGFDSEAAAQKALQETNQSFMGTSRLQVEECKPFGDVNKPRAWSEYSKDSSAYKRKHGDTSTPSSSNNKVQNDDEVESAASKRKRTEKEEELEKFMELQGFKKEKPIKLSVPDTNADTEQLVKELLEGVAGDTRMSLIFTGLPSSVKQKNLKEWLSPVRIKAMKIVRNDSAAAAFVTFNRPPDVRRALQRDQEFIGGYKVTIKNVEGDEEKEEQMDGAVNEEEDRAARATEEAKVREEILETGRLFVRNLPFTTKEEDLQYLFKKYGEVSEIQVIINKSTGACKGFAIVEYVFPESAVAAYAAEDGRVFKGRMLHIIAGSEKREPTNKEGVEKKEKPTEKSSFKKEKVAKMKQAAQKTHSWNALFLGANAVADTLAERLGVEKSDLLNSEGGESAGVRLALAETRLVRETRDFLISNGVSIDAFSRPAAARSNTVMLAKNLPAGVEPEELQRLFERHGDVQKILMPPEHGVSALIVMGNPVDAKKAFQALAYSRFRTQPLYLEWAPGDVFGEKKEQEEAAEKPSSSKSVGEKKEKVQATKNKRDMTYEEKREAKRKRMNGEDEVEEPEEEEKVEVEAEKKMMKKKEVKKTDGEEDEDQGIEPGSTVFVKNLAFDTTDASLKKLFGDRFHIKSAQVSKKLNPADPAKSLSMGFGFVQFYSEAEAKNAIRSMQGELLDGHSLELKISNREVVDKDSMKRKGVTATKQGESTKVMVRNLPFQASIKEIETLFSTFGEIRSIRIPRKVGSKDEHRGFGFVDFLSVGEAKRAMEALVHSTHLYGRRLVLEWAKEEDTVEEIRQKTAEKYSGEKKTMKRQKDRIEAIERDIKNIEQDEEDE